MRLYLLSCVYFVRSCTVVGTVASHGMSACHECMYMGIRRMKFLIDVCIRILKIRSILGSFWSNWSILTGFGQYDPKIELFLKIRVHRSIRNLILRTPRYLLCYHSRMSWHATVPTIMRVLREELHGSRYSRISWDVGMSGMYVHGYT